MKSFPKTLLLLATTATATMLAGGASTAANVDCAPDTACIGTPGRDLLDGSTGGEDLSGLGGGDLLRGHAGFDFLRGGPGDDLLLGDADGDTYVFEDGWGMDRVGDRSGVDSLDFSSLRGPVVVDLVAKDSVPEARAGSSTVDFWFGDLEQVGGGVAGDDIRGSAAANSLQGDDGDDTLDGRGGHDGIGGGRGNDRITGGPGEDIIVSRSGNDTIYAADGEADEISCGTGADKVYFDAVLDEINGNCEI